MSGVAWASTAVTDTGALVPCSCRSDLSAVQFGAISQLMPEPGRDIRTCFSAGHVYAAMKGQNTGRCLVVRDDGVQVVLGPTSGNQCVGIIPWVGDYAVMAVCVTNAIQCTQSMLTAGLNYWLDSIQPIPSAIQGTSQGFLNLSALGTPYWTDLHRTITLPNGVTLVLPLTVQNWTIGQGLVSPAQVSAWDGAKMYTVWQGDTSFPPQLAVSGSQVMAGIASSAAVFVPGPFGPYVVDPPTIPTEPTHPTEPTEPIVPVNDVVMFRRDGSNDPWNIGTVTPHSDGAPYVALSVTVWFGAPKSGYASLTPPGDWQEPKPNTTAWERFIPAGASLMSAPRDGGPGSVLDIASTSGKHQ